MSYTLLDGIPFYTKEEIDNEFSEGAVGDERARAEAAEQANAAAIEAEVTRATESENALQSQLQDVEGLAEQTSVELGAETIRAKAAENVNAGDIATERSRAIAAEGQIATDIITEAARATAAEQTVQNNVDAINAKIPVAASTQNQLADKAYVEDSIRVADASFRGSYATVSAIPTVYTDYPADSSGNKKPDDNDYIYVRDASGYQPETLTGCWKFKYTGNWDTDGIAGWLPEYAISDSVFTQAQVNALNSGADATKIAKIATNESNISDLQSDVSDIEALIPAEATAQNQLADKNSVDTAIAAAAGKLFIAEISVSIGHGSGGTTYQVTPITPRSDVIAAINAGKTIVVKAAWDSSSSSYVYFSFIARNPSGSDILTAYGAETFQSAGMQSQKTYVLVTNWTNYKLYELNLQRELSAGAGVTINSNGVISTDLFKVICTGSSRSDYGYTYNKTAADIRTALDAGKLVFGTNVHDGAIFFVKDQEEKLHTYTFIPYGLPGFVVEHDSSDIIPERKYYAYTEYINKSYIQFITLVGIKEVSVFSEDISTFTIAMYSNDNFFGKATIYNNRSTTLPIMYTDKNNTQKVFNLPSGQFATFIHSPVSTGCICEHTIPLTGTDDQGNAFAYDVVVRD